MSIINILHDVSQFIRHLHTCHWIAARKGDSDEARDLPGVTQQVHKLDSSLGLGHQSLDSLLYFLPDLALHGPFYDRQQDPKQPCSALENPDYQKASVETCPKSALWYILFILTLPPGALWNKCGFPLNGGFPGGTSGKELACQCQET